MKLTDTMLYTALIVNCLVSIVLLVASFWVVPNNSTISNIVELKPKIEWSYYTVQVNEKTKELELFENNVRVLEDKKVKAISFWASNKLNFNDSYYGSESDKSDPKGYAWETDIMNCGEKK